MRVQNLKFVALPVLEIIGVPEKFGQPLDNSDWSFGWGLRTPNLGEKETAAVGDGIVRKSVGEFL